MSLQQPIAIRYPRGRGVTINWQQPFKAIEIGTGICLKEGTKIAILSLGTIAKNVSEAISLAENTNEISHYDLRFLKPLDENLLHVVFKKHTTIITVEEGAIKGGFGSSVLEFAATNKYKNDVKIMGIPDKFMHHGSVEELQETVGLDTVSLAKKFADF